MNALTVLVGILVYGVFSSGVRGRRVAGNAVCSGEELTPGPIVFPVECCSLPCVAGFEPGLLGALGGFVALDAARPDTWTELDEDVPWRAPQMPTASASDSLQYEYKRPVLVSVFGHRG